MTPDQWQQVKELFHQATELPPEARPAFIKQRCNGDTELLDELELLLASHEEAKQFIEQPALAPVSEILSDEGTPWKGQTIGNYRVLGEIGRGGMGLVLLAVRADDQFKQRVAIKVLRRGMDTDDILERFRNERQILASLNHPNIATLHDGGSTSDGLPYLVMEHVEGLPLLQYLDEHNLSIKVRLELFRSICAAVHHAHQNLVIHRDLKPGNILVTNAGEVKLLDFGVAKLLNPEMDGGLTLTLANQRVMTPEYASPEQVRGQHVTTATDVYSLGVILYEMLTGARPYMLKDRSPEELSRAICDSEPSRPSDAARDAKNGRRGDTEKEQLASPRLRVSASVLRGDLDNIVLKALRKEPARRYSSVEQFSEDIRRHLEGLPVTARKVTLPYRAGKFVKRNKAGVAAAALVIIALMAGLIATTWQARVASAQRDRARLAQIKAERINTFLQDIFGSANPQAKGVNIKVIDVLNEASSRAKTELANQPEVLADALLTLGGTYISLGWYDKAEADLRAGLEASLKTNGEMHPTTAKTMAWLGLALNYLGQPQEGEQVSRRAVEIHRRLHSGGHEDLAVALYSLGANLIIQGEAKAAVPILQEAEGMLKQYSGEAHGYRLAALNLLGRALEQSDDLAGAESRYRQAIEVGRRVEYRYRIFLAQALIYLGPLLTNKGNYAEAESVLRESISVYREQGGDSNYSIGLGRSYLGSLYLLQGDYAKAELEFRESLDPLQENLGRQHAFTAAAMAGLGLTLTRAGKPTEGERYLREALETRKKVLPPGNVHISISESGLGECLSAQHRFGEAEPLLKSGYDGIKSKFGEQHQRAVEVRQHLANLYQAWGKPDQAAAYR